MCPESVTVFPASLLRSPAFTSRYTSHGLRLLGRVCKAGGGASNGGALRGRAVASARRHGPRQRHRPLPPAGRAHRRKGAGRPTCAYSGGSRSRMRQNSLPNGSATTAHSSSGSVSGKGPGGFTRLPPRAITSPTARSTSATVRSDGPGSSAPFSLGDQLQEDRARRDIAEPRELPLPGGEPRWKPRDRGPEALADIEVGDVDHDTAQGTDGHADNLPRVPPPRHGSVEGRQSMIAAVLLATGAQRARLFACGLTTARVPRSGFADTP